MCTELKCECGSESFKITKKEDCTNCEHNGADSD